MIPSMNITRNYKRRLMTRVYPKPWRYETHVTKNNCLCRHVDDLNRIISVEEQ